MLMKIIRKCRDCGFFRVTNPTNYIFKGAAMCSYRSKKLIDDTFPDWCPLEDAPNTPLHVDRQGREAEINETG